MSSNLLNRATASQLKLKRIKPDLYIYRAYVHQALDSEFGFREIAENKFKSFRKDIKELSIIELNSICKYYEEDNELVEWFYFFDTNNNFDKEDYKNFPKLFTNLIQLSFDQGGLCVMQLFDSQIYELYSFNGKFIIGPCHDLDLLVNGKFIERSSGNSYGFDIYEYHSTNNKIKHIANYGDFDVERILGINNRDRIKFNENGLPAGRVENFHKPISIEDAKNLLIDENTNWVTSPELIKYYENDLELALIAVKRDPLAFTLLTSKLQTEKILQQIVFNFEFCNEYYFNLTELFSLDELKSICTEDNDLFKFLSNELKADREFILSCLKNNSENDNSNTSAIKYIDDSLKSDFEIGLLSVKNNLSNLNYLSDNLKSNFLFIRKAICFKEYAYRFASEELSNNKELIFYSKYYYNFPFDFSELHDSSKKLDFKIEDILKPNSREEALIALKDMSTKWITSPELIKFYENDLELALIAINRESNVFHFLSDQLKQDFRLQKLAFNFVNCEFYKFNIHELYSKDEIENFCKQDNRFFKFLSDELKSDKEFILKCMEKNYHPDIYDFNAIQYLSDSIRNDFDVAMKFVMIDGLNLKWLSNELKNNIDIVKEAACQNPESILLASDEIQKNKDKLLIIIDKNPFVLNHLEDKFKNDKSLVLFSLERNYFLYNSLTDEMKNDIDVLNFYQNKRKKNFDDVLPFF